MLNVRKYNLLLANGLVWLAVGTKILLIGLGAYGRLAGQRPLWPLILISLAVFAGFYWMFTGVVRKYAARITGLTEERPSLLKTFSPKGYILIAFMISLGIGLKHIPGIGDAFFAAFYCGLGPVSFPPASASSSADCASQTTPPELAPHGDGDSSG